MANLQVTNGVISGQKILLQAIVDKNASLIQEKVHEQFIFTSPRAVVLNKENFVQYFTSNPEMKFEIFQLSDEHIVIIDNIAILHCLVQVKLINQPDFWERVTFTLINQIDTWLTLTMNATFVPEVK
jgi:hypothetical protein